MRTAVRRALLGLLAVLLIAGAWTALALLHARGDLQDARELLEAAREAEDLEAARPQLARAGVHLEDASSRLSQPGPWLVGKLPLAGRTVAAVRAASDAGAAVVVGAGELLDAQPERLIAGSRLDLDSAAELETALRAASARARGPVGRLAAVQLAGTPNAVSGPVEQVREIVSGVPDTLTRAADGMAALRGVLGADSERRLLVVLQNNAELRATGGLISVFAEATARRGQLELGSFRSVADVANGTATARQVPAPEDFRRLFGPFSADTTLWKNVNMSADVPTSSAVLAEVAAATLPTRPDAMIWVDVPAIAAILRATGPLTLPDGSELTADNAVRRLLSEAYARAQQDDEGQERRQDELRAAGDAVLGELLGPQAQTSAVDLARELVPAAAGRHLAVWSADPQEQELLVSARLAGQARSEGGDLSSFALHNLGDGQDLGNKLDYYSRRQVTVRVEVESEAATVEQSLEVRNTAPERGLPRYVAGEVDPGVNNQLVSMAVPLAAERVVLTRNGQLVTVDPQPLLDHRLITDVVSIPPGFTVHWRLRYRLPVEEGRYTTRLVPQPLAVDAGLLLQVQAADGRELDTGPVERNGPYDEVVRVDVTSRRPPAWERALDAVRRFWNEPVRLP